jgi:reductive dehalogenase
MKTILTVTSLMWLGGWGTFGFRSLLEKEPRATRRSLLVGLAGGIVLFLPGFLPPPLPQIAGALVVLGLLTGILIFLLPIGETALRHDTPTRRVDERTIHFSRARLEPGSEAHQAYYADHPEHHQIDQKTRALPGLLSPEAKLAHPLHFASTTGSFFLTEALREAVNGPVNEDQTHLTQEEITPFLTSLAMYYGALEVGITELEAVHIYTHTGRGTGTYGAPIELDHTHALAFTVEMDFEMVGAAPNPPLTMESGRQYVEAARVAVQLAAAIRDLGYRARAHIDGNYQVIAPLVARDAGLGEIGRMGLLMTPRQGPRVRLGVVTTDLPLTPSPRTPDASVIDFCRICQKCAENCPSRSIPFGDREQIDGALRWQINADTCFQYWNAVGTDCGKCMAVCPYAHPDSLIHNLVRWGIRRSGAFRRLALWLDDFFYGRYPEAKEGPAWLRGDHP